MNTRTRQSLILIAGFTSVIGVIWWFYLNGNEELRRNWQYDLNTGELFSSEIYGDQPQVAPSGDLRGAPPGTPAGVTAMVVRINGENLKILYIQQTPKLYADPSAPRTASGAINNALVATVPASPGDVPLWQGMLTREGQEIIVNAKNELRGKEWELDQP